MQMQYLRKLVPHQAVRYSEFACQGCSALRLAWHKLGKNLFRGWCCPLHCSAPPKLLNVVCSGDHQSLDPLSLLDELLELSDDPHDESLPEEKDERSFSYETGLGSGVGVGVGVGE